MTRLLKKFTAETDGHSFNNLPAFGELAGGQEYMQSGVASFLTNTHSDESSGRSRICKVERRRREDRGAEGAEGVGFREGVSILSPKMANFSAFWALFLQFIVHSSMDCLKRFRRQKPLLVG